MGRFSVDTPDFTDEHPPSPLLPDGGEPSGNRDPDGTPDETDSTDPEPSGDSRDRDRDPEDDGETKNVNIEIPSETATDGLRYAPAEIPIGQYEILDDIKDDYGLTWRGMLMITRRDLDGDICDDTDQYEAINGTRQFHGLTWRGMLIHAVRVLGEAHRLEVTDSDSCRSSPDNGCTS